mmetsp:Transcript_106602/g.299514  ORF Transcript_106602/g.299514 Transcript_106602/m.299514 type:complete len:592 (-) Transcript_106602:52-1827(-)
MKRSFSEYDPEEALVSGSAAKLSPGGGRFAMKCLFSEPEIEAMTSYSMEIQQITGAALNTNGKLYPGTQLQELNISGPSSDSVVQALIYGMTRIVQESGALTNGEENAPPGESRFKTILPTKSAASIIGKGGENIMQLRQMTGLHVHVEKNALPPQGGELSEQIVSFSGNFQGIQDALPFVVENVEPLVGEAWFLSWATSSNAGLVVPGLQFEFSGKGLKGGGKGDGKSYMHPAGVPILGPPAGCGSHGAAAGKGSMGVGHGVGASFGQTGEICQFFARAGWCKFGDLCRHGHVVPPQNAGASFAQHSGEICQFFAKAGWCKYGDQCKHLHATAGSELMPPSQQPPSQGKLIIGPAAIAAAKASGVTPTPGRPPSGFHAASAPPRLDWPPPSGAPSSSGEICQFFAKAGWCKFGDLCRHVHNGVPAQGNSMPPYNGQLVCRFFASGGCKFGDACRNLHTMDGPIQIPAPSGEVCQFFARSGWCKWGDACRHAHVVNGQPQTTNDSLQSAGNALTWPGVNGGGCLGQASARGGQQSEEICNFYARAGFCKYGDQCRYIHIGNAAGGAPTGTIVLPQTAVAAGDVQAERKQLW